MLFGEKSAFNETEEARKYSQWAVDRFFNYARSPTVIAQQILLVKRV